MLTKKYYTHKLCYTINEKEEPVVGSAFKYEGETAILDSLTRECCVIKATSAPKKLRELKCDGLFIGETALQQSITEITSQVQLSATDIIALKRMIQAQLALTKVDEIAKIYRNKHKNGDDGLSL